MNLTVFNSLGKAFSTIGFQIRKHSPEIMIVGGIIGGAGATVLACIATAKSAEVVEEAKEELAEIDENLNGEDNEYTEEDAKKDKRSVYIHTGGRLALMYLPSVGLGIASVASILGGTGILNKRNAVLASSLAASIGEFNEYRKRLVEKFGEDGERIDKELRFGTEEVDIKEKIEDGNGKTKTVKKKVTAISNSEDFDGYRRVFDPRNPYWDKDPTYCEVFLSARQAMFNDRLRAYGYVFLNDVLEELGFPKTRVGQEVGWIYDPNNGNIDNYIDFGITPVQIIRKDGQDEYTYIENGDRCSGYLLDFNVDGSVLNKASFPDQTNPQVLSSTLK